MFQLPSSVFETIMDVETDCKEGSCEACPSPSIPYCSHGLPEDDELLNHRKTVISDYMTRLTQLYEGLAQNEAAESELLDEGIKLYSVYWKLHADAVDSRLVDALYGAAADALRNEMFGEARTLTHLGITLESIVSGRNTKKAKNMKRTVTERGIKIYLASKLNCECLSRLKKDAKNAPKTNLCFYCQQEFSLDNIMKCSGCKLARYCSKECQKSDWVATHKEQCSNFCQLYGNKTSTR